MKIYISGTTGYLGSHLCELSKRFYETISINRNFCEGSISYEEFKSINDNSEKTFIHCAGLAHSKSLGYEHFYDANVSLSKKLGFIASEKNFSKFVYISSVGVHGNSKENISTQSNFDPYDDYTRSKLEAEKELQKIFSSSTCRLIIVRPPLIVGKYAPGNISRIEKLLNSIPITPFGSVKNKRSIIKIENLCEILINVNKLSDDILIPSEKELLSTSEIFDLVAGYHSKKFYHIPIPPKILDYSFKLLKNSNLRQNILGNLVIE